MGRRCDVWLGHPAQNCTSLYRAAVRVLVGNAFIIRSCQSPNVIDRLSLYVTYRRMSTGKSRNSGHSGKIVGEFAATVVTAET